MPPRVDLTPKNGLCMPLNRIDLWKPCRILDQGPLCKQAIASPIESHPQARQPTQFPSPYLLTREERCVHKRLLEFTQKYVTVLSQKPVPQIP